MICFNWDAVIAGMSHVPEESTLRDIFLRELRKSTKMKHDLETCERAKDGTKEHRYHWLIQSVRDLLNRERTHKNRQQIARAHGDKFGAPAPNIPRRPNASGGRGRSILEKGICYDFQRGKCNRGDKCKYLHKTRSPSPQPRKINKPCMFWKKGKCNKGDKCLFRHDGPPGKPSGPPRPPSNAPPSAATPAKDGKPRSPSPAPKRRPSRGRSRSKEKTRTAACCLSYALAAPTKRQVRINPKPHVRHIDVEGKGAPHLTRQRRYSTVYVDGSQCPKTR